MRQFGRQDELAFRVRPLPGAPGEPDPSAAATWVALSIWVDGTNVTEHVHDDDEQRCDGLHWPAIHLARWLTSAWPDLFETARCPVPIRGHGLRDLVRRWDEELDEEDADDEAFDVRDRYVATHALEAGAAGGLVPSIWIAREGHQVLVEWDTPGRPGGASFLAARGEARVPATGFAEAVVGFVTWVRDAVGASEAPAAAEEAARLSEWLDDLRSARRAEDLLWSFAGVGDQARRRLRGRLRSRKRIAEFFGLPEDWWTQGGLADPSRSTLAVAYRCLSPSLSADDLEALRDTLLSVKPHPLARDALRRFAAGVSSPDPAELDHVQGYRLAQEVRASLGNDDGRLDVENVLDTLGVPVVDVELSDDELDGGCVCDKQHGPAAFVNVAALQAGTPHGRRMALAHELCHLLFDRSRAIPLAIISGPWAPARLERRANAFAAELLLPRKGLRRVLGSRRASKVTPDEHKALMDEFGVGWEVSSWQLTHRLGPSW